MAVSSTVIVTIPLIILFLGLVGAIGIIFHYYKFEPVISHTKQLETNGLIIVNNHEHIEMGNSNHSKIS